MGTYPQLDGCQVHLPVAGGFGLSLSLDPNLFYFALDLTTPDQAPINIAWDDQAHWHPHVLRWSELETICRAAALHDHDLTHPGWSVLLLHRFCPICAGDDLESIVGTLETAWKKIGDFSDSDIATFIERLDARDAGFRWRLVEQLGWCLEQEDRESATRGLYTLRHSESTKFPFRAWNEMISAAERALTTNATSSAPIQPSPGCMPRAKLHLYLTIPHEDSSRPVPTAFAHVFGATLDRVLRDLHRGRSGVSGGTSRKNEDEGYTQVDTRYFVHLRGDWNANRELICDLLWWSRAPASVLLSEGFKHKLPLDLTKPPNGPSPRVLQLAGLKTERWRTGYRYDHVSFTEAQRQSLQRILVQHQAAGPNRDGWYSLTLGDGGQLSLCARRLQGDEPLDAVTISMEALTPQTSALVHQLMTENNWMLLPSFVAATTSVAEQVTQPWPHVQLAESPAALHEILRAGAFDWWNQF